MYKISTFQHISRISHGPLVEQLDVSVLHVVFVLLQRPLRLVLGGEGDLGVAAGPAVLVVLDHHVLAVRHGAEPLQ